MARKLIFRVPAVQRMFERQISVEDVKAVLETGETLESYPDDMPYTSRLILGWRGTRPLHVVVAESSEEDQAIVVTAYEPDSSLWQPGFRRRKP